MHRSFMPTLECLEGRLVPAGIINSSYSSVTKTLTLIAVNDLTPGNATLNHQDITISGTGTAGSFTIGANDGETINGVAAGAATISNVKNIKLVMGLGNDTVVIENAELTGLITFLGGDGDNFLDINANGGDNALGTVKVSNGDGNDTFAMRNGTNTIGGKLTINNGLGDGFTGFGQTAGDLSGVAGAIRITNGAGDDIVECLGEQVQFLSSVTIRNGNGGSTFMMQANTVNSISGTLTIINGEGVDNAFFGDAGAGSISLGKVSLRNGTGGSFTAFQGSTNTIAGSLEVSNGDGDDFFSCDSATALTVTGAVTLQNGAGDTDTNWDATTTTIGGLTTLSSTAGDDEITFAGTTANLHSVKILTGNGESQVQCNSTNAVNITGNLTLTGGADQDSLLVPASSDLNVTGSVSITLGGSSGISENLVSWQGTTTIGGNLAIRGGDYEDSVSLRRLDVDGTVLIDLGNGDDLVDISDSTFAAAVTIRAGAGIDDIRLETFGSGSGTTFNGPVTVLGGSGDDTLEVGFDIDDFAAFTAAPIKFDGGSGLDTLSLAPENVFPANQPIEVSWETIS
jgi:hypothetical protein